MKYKSTIIIFLLFVCSTLLYSKNLTVFNIVPAHDGHYKEIAEDIVRIQKEKIAGESLMIFNLVPEGNPPIDKFEVLGKRFKKVQDEIGGRAKFGVLLQSTLGHGYVLKNPNALEHMVCISTKKDVIYRCCPLGEKVGEYMADICRKAAMLKPTHIMVDDDFRMYTNADKAGCLCPAHLAKISEKLGRKIDLNEAHARVMGTSDEDKRIAKIIDEVIIDSICALAQKMRDAIDEIDPTIRGSVCVCNADIRYADRLGRIFAGKGYEPIIRINNARYASMAVSPRNFATTMTKSIQQLAPLKNKGIIIAETDTLPHNRYGTSARSLHSNYCGYIIDGCQGSKQWITLTSEYNPNNNEAFRKILAEHSDFYESIAEEVKNVKSCKGFATLIPEKPYYNMNPFNGIGYVADNTWAQKLCCVAGIPVNFAYVGNNAGYISISELKYFSDAEIKKQLACGIAIDGATAVELCKRGYAKLIGVDAEFYKEHRINAEMITQDSINGNLAGKLLVGTQGLVKLTPNSTKTRTLSNFMSKKFGQDDKSNFELISPASTYFENELGGKVLVYGYRIGGDHLNSFSRYPRKEFFLNAFNYIDPFRIWYPYDAEMYVKSHTLKDNSELVGLFNFGYDPLETVELAFTEKPKSLKILTKQGKWEDLNFDVNGNILSISKRLEPMYPMILKFFY